MKHGPFDVVIVGSGPAGYVAAIRAGQLGLKTAIVERDGKYGGTCLWRGCIPTKALLHDAYLYEQVKDAKRYGIEVENVRLNWDGVRKHKDLVVRKLGLGVEGLLKKNKVQLFTGTGVVKRPGLVGVGADEIEAKNIVLATGSEPKWFPGMEPDGKGIITSTEALDLAAVPKSLAVIGAGAVGIEFASIYRSFGAEVSVIEMMPQIVPLEDEEVAREVEKVLAKRGMKFYTGAKVETIKPGYEILIAHDGKSETVRAEKVLVAVGRKPNTDKIGIENTKVKVDRGFVKVNGFMETDEPGVYAIGDIVPTPMLAHVGSAEGILAVEKMAGKPVHPIRYDRVPAVTYCDPQVASVGLTEKQARAKGHAVKCGRFPFAGIGKASIEGENEGFVKIVGETKYGEILGVHILHAHAGEMISEAVAVLNGELTAEDLAHAIHPHPTLSEAVAEATHAFFGQAIHI
ncbi:MAG: dihydrolipoyl dehydrogenase [Planctomycetes bacterium]|nr:dihydrolipoyl dehydrogenase [Planctomycetota bacterium]